MGIQEKIFKYQQNKEAQQFAKELHEASELNIHPEIQIPKNNIIDKLEGLALQGRDIWTFLLTKVDTKSNVNPVPTHEIVGIESIIDFTNTTEELEYIIGQHPKS